MTKVEDYFDVEYGNSLSLSDLEQDKRGVNFVSRTSKNNGVSAKVKAVRGEKLNHPFTITVAVGGSVMESFLQKTPYYTGYHILVLKPKIKLTENQLLFYCMCLRANKYRYSYGRQANKTLENVEIPSIKEIPSWVNNLPTPKIPSSQPAKENEIRFDHHKMKEFKIKDYFLPTKGRRFTSINRKNNSGKFPYISSTTLNNGIAGYVSRFTHEGNQLTIVCYGEPAVTYYHKGKIWASDSVNVLSPKFKEFNIYVAMFLKTIIENNKHLFNYNRGLTIERLDSFRVKLPTDKEGNPDWEFMEDYIKSLPYSKALEN